MQIPNSEQLLQLRGSTSFAVILFVMYFICVEALLTFLTQYGKTWNEFRGKLDNVVWTCCILHNLLLRHDNLEFLWTPAWVCSWAFEDPDKDHRDDFDGPPIEMRSKRRMRARCVCGFKLNDK